jgi:hypothetical protein
VSRGGKSGPLLSRRGADVHRNDLWFNPLN